MNQLFGANKRFIFHQMEEVASGRSVTMNQEVQFESWNSAQKEGNTKMQPPHQSE